MSDRVIRLAKAGMQKITCDIRTRIAVKTKLPVSKPSQIYIILTNKCNFHCKMCPQWETGLSEDAKEYMTPDQLKHVIDQMSDWGISSIGLSGGEPLIYKDKILDILQYANSMGIYSHITTNGSLLKEDFIREYDRIGGGHISLSLDGASALTHDNLRGFDGAFEAVKNAFELFDAIRPQNINLKVNTVLSDGNLGEVMDILDFVGKHGSSLWVQPYDPYDWATRDKMGWKEKNENYPLWVSPDNYDRLVEVIERLTEEKQKDAALILNDMEHLKAIPSYFAMKKGLREELGRCLVAYKSFTVNPNGDVSVCRYGTVGNVTEQPLKEIWNSRRYEDVRELSKSCIFVCLLGCMFDPKITSIIRNGPRIMAKFIRSRDKS